MRTQTETRFDRRTRTTEMKVSSVHREDAGGRNGATRPSTRERFPGLLGGMLGCVAALVTLGSPFDSAKAEAAALRTCAEDGPMMHASTESIPANAEPSVLISGVETWSEYRQKTDRTYVDEKGEIQPLYQLLRPEKGHVYLHVVAYVATDSPRSWATDEILVVDSVGAEPEWQAAPLAAFDEQGIVRIGAVTAPSQKVALDLMYEVPAGSWPEFYLKIDDQSYGPFHEYQELAPVAASAASALF